MLDHQYLMIFFVLNFVFFFLIVKIHNFFKYFFLNTFIQIMLIIKFFMLNHLKFLFYRPLHYLHYHENNIHKNELLIIEKLRSYPKYFQHFYCS